MWNRDIRRAIILVVVAALASLAINEARTPVVNAVADSGKISHAKGWDLSGLKLIDNWSHGGWVKVAKAEPDTSASPGNSKRSKSEPQVWPIGTIEAKQLFDDGDCIFLDAREPKYYEEGHIAGALSWPSESFDAKLERFQDLIPLDKCVVAYCSGGACDESSHLATSLIVEGWQEVYLYESGFDEWKVAGYPIETGPEPKTEPDPD